MSILLRILVVVYCTALGHGIVFAFGLDQKVANAIRVAMTPEWREAVSWMLAGSFGLLGLGGWEIWHRSHRRGDHPDWDITINQVLNYIVNDSRELFPDPPKMQIGHTLVPASGTQHQSALVRLNERVASGRVDVSGYREILPQPAPHQFENIRRAIPLDYWHHAALNSLSCFAYTNRIPQTYVNDEKYPR